MDDSHKRPIIGPVSHMDTCGRGLLIVQEIADDWGVEIGTAGKAVWFTLAC